MPELNGPHYASKAYYRGEETSDEPEPTGSEFPKHTGGGWYELSNGEKVQGKEEAEEAEAAL